MAEQPKYMSREEASAILSQCDGQLESVAKDLRDAKELAQRAGLWRGETSILDVTFPDSSSRNLAVLRTTGGHSNTDHLVTLTGDARKDRIAELKRAMQRRARAMQPENKGEDRWDKPRIPGERRRRILREKDKPEAPPEPPPSGYVVFVGQMTTKVRHERPNNHHNQIKVVKEIAKIWKYGISEEDRDYYNVFAREAREEYEEQYREYRATGRFMPSTTFKKLGPLWVRMKEHEKNSLEREIDSYDTVVFSPRPNAEMDEAYRKREEERKQRRKEQQRKASIEDQEEEGVADQVDASKKRLGKRKAGD